MILRVVQAAVCSLWTTLRVDYDTSIVASCNSLASAQISENQCRKPPSEGTDGSRSYFDKGSTSGNRRTLHRCGSRGRGTLRRRSEVFWLGCHFEERPIVDGLAPLLAAVAMNVNGRAVLTNSEGVASIR
jgi:hypothetical protein